MSKIKTSTITSIYPLRLLTPHLSPGSPGLHWTRFRSHVIGLTDFRARSGPFTTPWQALSPYRQPLPDLTIAETRSLSDLMDTRAQEIYANAKKLNKQIMLMWSGGIDSTSVLVSLLKNIPTNEHKDLLVICLTPDSLLENFSFYRKFISTSQIPVVHKLTVNFSNDFLNRYIVLHGDPGDAIFGSGSRKFKSLAEDQRYLLPYRDNMELIYSCGTKLFPDTWKFLADKITANLEEIHLDQIVSIADWFWWQYINFKWEGSLWRPMHAAAFRQDHTSPITKENTLSYLENTFFATDYFQRWSYTNIHNFYPGGLSGHKHEIKDYIFEFDNNLAFKQQKTKMASLAIDLIDDVEHNLWERPVYYDENWVGYTFQDPEVYQEVLELLQSYNG